MNKLNLSFCALALFFFGNASGQQAPKPNPALLKTINAEFKDAGRQYHVLMKNLPPDQFPKTFYPVTGKFEACKSDWWVSGFYPGTLLYLYQQTKDQGLYNEAERILKVLEKEKNNKTTHDLGFMMYCSFGLANQIKPKPAYKDILLTSAKSLASRFNPTVGCIESWDSKVPDFLVIIDNMMNLELLFWATRATGDSSYYKIAVTHANTTLKNHFRTDFSSYHVIDYDTLTGKVLQKVTAQGYANESAWARGQAWALYGYTMCYRETKNRVYLIQADGIADFILNNKITPVDGIPYWDYNDPKIPETSRDASAASITASALYELAKYSAHAKKYKAAADKILNSLTTKYTGKIGSNYGFILTHSTGHRPAKSEIDVPINYADYYYLEALLRSKK